MRDPVFCSAVIPTIGRSSLGRAVLSVLEQDFNGAPFEVIVINDSGRSLPDETWQASPRVRVIHSARRERSVARNAGAAVAQGDYLLFLDDDDLILPGAMRAFWDLARRRPDAVWLYGSYQTVDNDGGLVAEFDPGLEGDILPALVSGESIPFQASLLRASAFNTTGAFDPALVGVEDRDLGRRLAWCGAVAGMTSVVARIRVGQAGSTTNWGSIAECDRRGREKVLRVPDAWRRLRSSARTPYWRGRITRAYAASAVWNLKQGRMIAAIRRAVTALGFIPAVLFLPDFWRGLCAQPE